MATRPLDHLAALDASPWPASPVDGLAPGARIGRLLRNSTERQVGNWSEREQDEGLALRIAEQGGIVVPYDEQATSGRDLSKRRVALRMLADVEAGTIRGIAAYDVKRLTRDEFGVDGGIIARRLIDARAALITYSKTYHLWIDDDLLQFQFQCLIAGIDIRGKKRELWRGVFARAIREVFFITYPPLGYATRLIEQASAGRRDDRLAIKRVPIKDDAAAPLMAALAEAFDRATTLGEAARALNEAGLRRTGRKGRHRGLELAWTTDALWKILHNPLYGGVWEFGSTCDRRNTIWEGYRDRPFRHEVPELAWWDQATVARWRRTFADARKGIGPARRARTHRHLLKGILACASCGSTLVAVGVNRGEPRYGCRIRHDPARCPAPQTIGESVAFRELRRVLPAILRDGRALRAAGVAVEGEERSGDLARALAVRREQLAQATTDWMGMPSLARHALGQKIAELAEDVDRMAAEVDRDRARQLDAADRDVVYRLLGDDAANLAAFDDQAAMPDVDRAAIYRDLVADVRIAGTGHGTARTFEIIGYRVLG